MASAGRGREEVRGRLERPTEGSWGAGAMARGDRRAGRPLPASWCEWFPPRPACSGVAGRGRWLGLRDRTHAFRRRGGCGRGQPRGRECAAPLLRRRPPCSPPAAPRPPACLRLPAVPAPRAAATLLRGVPEAGGQTCRSFPPSVAHRAGEWPCRRCGLGLRGGAERADARPALAAVFPRRLLGGLPAHGALCPLVSGESGLSAIRPWAGQPSDLPCDHGQGSPAQVARPGRTR